jgi:hypothetical protein
MNCVIKQLIGNVKMLKIVPSNICEPAVFSQNKLCCILIFVNQGGLLNKQKSHFLLPTTQFKQSLFNEIISSFNNQQQISSRLKEK